MQPHKQIGVVGYLWVHPQSAPFNWILFWFYSYSLYHYNSGYLCIQKAVIPHGHSQSVFSISLHGRQRNWVITKTQMVSFISPFKEEEASVGSGKDGTQTFMQKRVCSCYWAKHTVGVCITQPLIAGFWSRNCEVKFQEAVCKIFLLALFMCESFFSPGLCFVKFFGGFSTGCFYCVAGTVAFNTYSLSLLWTCPNFVKFYLQRLPIVLFPLFHYWTKGSWSKHNIYC